MIERQRQPRTHHNLKNLPSQTTATKRAEQQVVMLNRQRLTQEQIAVAMGRSIRWVKNTMTMLRHEGRL